jgi:DNA (cytosine-5)-methyltransferase 1
LSGLPRRRKFADRGDMGDGVNGLPGQDPGPRLWDHGGLLQVDRQGTGPVRPVAGQPAHYTCVILAASLCEVDDAAKTTFRTLRTLDLFAGAGGLTLGFEMADVGFLPVFAVEVEPAAVRTYKQNFGCHVWDGPIEGLDVFPDADIIIGGPPCQGFSPLGRDRDDLSRAVLNELWQHYLRAVRQVRPEAFIIENVPEFQKSAQFAKLLDTMKSDKELRKYQFSYGVLNAADYGVPQRRRRGILIAVRGTRPVEWPPPPTHGPQSAGQTPYATVRDAIADLPARPTEEDLHLGRKPRPESLERYRAIPEGGNRFDLQRNRPDLTPRCWAEKPTGTTDVMGRLWWDRPALTIRTEFFKPEKGRYLHPTADRPITHREAARLQSFPDSFEFEGSKIEIARQIGNAVPPLLALAVARHARAHLE